MNAGRTHLFTSDAAPDDARKIVLAEKRKRALRGTGIGALWCVGGVAAGLIAETLTLASAAPFVFWGAILFGSFRLVSNGITYLTAKA